MVSLAVAFAFSILLGRLFYLHIWEHEELLEHVEGNRKTINLIEAQRGNIVDTRGNLLAVTRTSYNIGLDPQSVRETDREKLSELARLMGKPLREIEAAFDTKVRTGGEKSKEGKTGLIYFTRSNPVIITDQLKLSMKNAVRVLYPFWGTGCS